MEPPPFDLPAPDPSPILEGNSPPLGDAAADSETWRSELSARLSHYRARRKAPPPRYPSLRLPFGPATSALKVSTQYAPLPTDQIVRAPDASPELEDSPEPTQATHSLLPEPVRSVESKVRSNAGSAGAKIIEFPRLAWAPPPPPLDQLAEPVGDFPRILEVPEVAPPAPALGGITIEPVAVEEPRKHPGIDSPLENASLGRRFLAALIDGLIIATASALSGFVFWKIALVRPPQIQLWTLAALVPCLFWAAYHYLLTVYSGSTPGLRAARLQLTRFDGKPTTRSLRRWRVFASYLSAASLGMGYVWLFLDEDALCWHDRITRTYLAPGK